MRHWVGMLVLLAVASPAGAGDLCKDNSFTKTQATKGRWAYDSSCGLCHTYRLTGRVPGESASELPAISVLDANYLKTLDTNGGVIPSLISDAFIRKWKDQKAFMDRIATAASGFPPRNYVKDESEIQLAAYILYVRCGKM